MINKILYAIIDWLDLLIMKITYHINRINKKQNKATSDRIRKRMIKAIKLRIPEDTQENTKDIKWIGLDLGYEEKDKKNK